MRWLSLRKANVDPELRTMLEQYGVPVIQQILLVGSGFRYKGYAIGHKPLQKQVLAWLTERYDREERKETWLITMEVAITVLVASELLMSIVSFVVRNAK